MLVGADGERWERLRVVLHVHTTVSTGTLDPEDVVALAGRSGLDGVVFTDSLLRRWEYGLWPLQGVIRKVVEQPSVLQYGAQRYLDRIAQLHKKSRVIAMAATEAAPFYYWRRSPLDRLGGEIRGWNQHLLVLGLGAQAMERLPLDHDPYHGDKGAAPYQQFIDAAAAAGGLVIWAHPGSAHVGSHGGILDNTEPYPHLLAMTTGYQGFAITYLGYLSIAEPGGVWDRLLSAYCQGRRPQPVWIIGESDWRGPQERPLEMVTTELLADERSADGVLRALRAGRAWAVIRSGASQLQLDQFSVEGAEPSAGATVGGRVQARGPVRIIVAGRRNPEAAEAMTLTVVHDGEVLAREEIRDAVFTRSWAGPAPAAAGYYRVMMEEPSGVLYTNPVFVQ